LLIGRACTLVCACAVYVATLALADGRAQAALFTVSVDYDGGPGCPDVQVFEAAVRARLGYDPFAAAAPDHVSVRITPGTGVIDGHLEWRDSTGRWAGDQTLPVATKDCRHLVRALAAALAVQIQLLAATRESGDGPAVAKSSGPPPERSMPQPAPPPVPRSVPQSVPESSVPQSKPQSTIAPISQVETPASTVETTPLPPRPPRGPGPVWALGAGTSVGFGMSSSPVLLGQVLGGLGWEHVSVELAAEASLPSTTRRLDGAGIAQQHLLASAAACGKLTRWRACLLANAGGVRMRGVDIDLPKSAVMPVVQTGARLGIVQPLKSGCFLDAHADGLVNVFRWRGTLDDVAVWTAPRFAAVLGVDVGFRSR
jgi:hypothetical protein